MKWLRQLGATPADEFSGVRGEGWNKNVDLYKSRAIHFTLDPLLNRWEVGDDAYLAKPTTTVEELYQYQFQREFKAKKIQGPILCYRSNKILFFKGNYNRETGRLDGEWEEYYEKGQLFIRENWKDGNRHGIYESFHKNGQLMTKDNWVEGELVGLQEGYFDDGKLYFRNNFKYKTLHGPSETFHVNGNLASSGYFKRGKKIGIWKFFSIENRNELTITEKFDSNLKETFDSKGNLTRREYFKPWVIEEWEKGELVSEWNYEDEAKFMDEGTPFDNF